MAQSCILSERREAGARAEPRGHQPMGVRARPLARQRRVVNPAPAAAARSAASSLLHSPGRPRILRLPAPLRRPPWTKVSLLIYQIFSGCLKIRTLPGGHLLLCFVAGLARVWLFKFIEQFCSSSISWELVLLGTSERA